MGLESAGRAQETEGVPARGGLTARVEAASRTKVPPPKGRGTVMLILAVLVVVALVMEFTGHSSVGRAVERAGAESQPVLAPDDGAEDGQQRPMPEDGRRKGMTPPAESWTLMLSVGDGAGQAALSSADAVQFFLGADEESRTAFLAQLLDALAPACERGGRAGAEAFELAARFAHGASPDSRAALDRITLRVPRALSDDVVAPAALLYLEALPDRGGSLLASALDEVILARGRPLALRVAAARLRARADRPTALRALAADPTTHPALKAALE